MVVDLAVSSFLRLSSRGEALVAELLRLSEHIPRLFLLQDKNDQKQYGDVLHDFRYLKTPELFAIESFANVHHLVSTVTGRLAEGQGTAELLRAAFPPGSITGAPKIQAMKVIAALEPPRGPYCGSIFWAGADGAFDSSVLIRTAALLEDPEGWRVEARAGAGIVADSQPEAERAETEAKVAALRAALEGPSLAAASCAPASPSTPAASCSATAGSRPSWSGRDSRSGGRAIWAG